MTSHDDDDSDLISRPLPVPEVELAELRLILRQGNVFLLQSALLYHMVEQRMALLHGIPAAVHELHEKKVLRQQQAPLSPRETEVLWLAGQELCNDEIGEVLGITGGTVKNHMTSILSKLQARNRWQAVVRGRELGLV